jgi:succinate dehydrogenase / fumarate reductase membrane anchor subunit
MNYRSPLSNAQGLGSAKSGTSHWWMQRVTAVALLPLTYVLIRFLDLSLNAPYEQTQAWLAAPFNAVCLIAWILAVFYHAALGLRVVVEDYIASEGRKIISVWLVNLVFLFLALVALIAIFRTISAG